MCANKRLIVIYIFYFCPSDSHMNRMNNNGRSREDGDLDLQNEMTFISQPSQSIAEHEPDGKTVVIYEKRATFPFGKTVDMKHFVNLYSKVA